MGRRYIIVELVAFRDAGAKLIVLHRVSDPEFSLVDSTNWYDKLDANNCDDAEKFTRFYRIPGMPHGTAGPNTDDFDMFSQLVGWVYQGTAPETVIAGLTEGSAEAHAAGFGGVARNMCLYPLVAHHEGGTPSTEASFAGN